MKITILGCGSSGGVPLIGGNWGVCDPQNPRNRRTRVSILVEQGDTSLLIDTSPDMRQQLLDANVKKLDAVLYTHAHADHCHGIDELRSINWLMQKPTPIYADPATMAELTRRFPYVFKGTGADNYYKPSVTPHEITSAFTIGDISIMPFKQNHGHIDTLGFRFGAVAVAPALAGAEQSRLNQTGNFAYSTDAHAFDDAAWETLQGIETWLVDCVRPEPHPTHSHLAQTLQWIERIKPQRAFLTHMNHMMDYDTLVATLPPGVAPAYDGQVIEC